jgi:purine nucleosidase
VKLILDTDIGSDIDDAVCLAYLLAQPRCELLGITTVSGGPVDRARIASAMCTYADRGDIPILPGMDRPLLGPQLQPDVPQSKALGAWPHRTEFAETSAIEWMQGVIREHPGEVTLLGIGPLTNIATLFTLDPEIPSMLRSLVLMAGSVNARAGWDSSSPMREWNVRCDPHAAQIVYRSRAADFRCFGLDVTLEVQLPAAEIRERFSLDRLRPVLDFADAWSASTDRPMYFHDPLAAAAIFAPQIVTMRRGHVDVETSGPALSGVTLWTADPDGPLEMGYAVDAEAFFAEYFAVVARD